MTGVTTITVVCVGYISWSKFRLLTFGSMQCCLIKNFWKAEKPVIKDGDVCVVKLSTVEAVCHSVGVDNQDTSLIRTPH